MVVSDSMQKPSGNAYFVPGYTGHCPLLKFHVGKSYGSDTRQIIKELHDGGFFKGSFATWKICENKAAAKPPPPPLVGSFPKIAANNRGEISRAKCILGYTGYIPGMYLQYGKPFRHLVDEFERAEMRRNKALSKDVHLVQKAAKELNDNPLQKTNAARKPSRYGENYYRGKGKYITSEFPPITGYTGHIPRLRISSLALSKPYHNAAKLGLSQVRR